jgi:hypothetical protein
VLALVPLYCIVIPGMSIHFLMAAMKSKCNYKHTRAGKKLGHRFIQPLDIQQQIVMTAQLFGCSGIPASRKNNLHHIRPLLKLCLKSRSNARKESAQTPKSMQSLEKKHSE